MSDRKIVVHTYDLPVPDAFAIEVVQERNGYVERISRQIVDTKEKHMRAALIVRGWTPPGGTQAEDFEKEVLHLLRYYCVTDITALIKAQDEHVKRLQGMLYPKD